MTLFSASDSFSRMAEDLKRRVRGDLVEARKARDKFRTVVLTTLLAEVKNQEIEEREQLDDAGMQTVVARTIKRCRDAAEQMRSGGRPDLAAKEETEAEILQAYLPPPLTEDDVRTIVRAAIAGGADQIGSVMGQIMPRLRGRFDGREASRIVREELA